MGVTWRNSLAEEQSLTELNCRWIFPHQSKSTPRTFPLSPFLLSPPRNSLGSYLPLMCAGRLCLCVYASKSPLIPFICTTGIRIEEQRVWTVVVRPADVSSRVRTHQSITRLFLLSSRTFISGVSFFQDTSNLKTTFLWFKYFLLRLPKKSGTIERNFSPCRTLFHPKN